MNEQNIGQSDETEIKTGSGEGSASADTESTRLVEKNVEGEQAKEKKSLFKSCAELIDRLSRHPKFGWVVQFAKFGLVGVSNTLIHLGVYYLCLYVFGLHYQLCNLFGFLISVTNAYFWSSRYVFKSGTKRTLGEHIVTYLKTVLGYGFTYVLSSVLLLLWVDVLHISDSIAPVINLFITVPLNFVINKFWTFRKKKKDAGLSADKQEEADLSDEQETSNR